MHRMLAVNVVAAVVFVATAAAIPAQVAGPMAELQSVIERVLNLLESASVGGSEHVEEPRQLATAVSSEAFDWEEASKRILGRHWQERTPEERREFSGLFADIVVRTFLGILGEERITIRYGGEAIAGNYAAVRTILIRAKEEIAIDYRMQKTDDRWRVYDIVIEGVSLIGSSRAQTNRLIQQYGYEELVKALKAKQSELIAEEAQRAGAVRNVGRSGS